MDKKLTKTEIKELLKDNVNYIKDAQELKQCALGELKLVEERIVLLQARKIELENMLK